MRQYIGGGKIETVLVCSTGQLIKETRYIGDHTEVTTVKWRKKAKP